MRFYFTAIFLLLINGPSAFAWSRQGHEIVADIGYSLLDARTKMIVNKYLGDVSIHQAGTWMDEIKRYHEYDYLKPMHYINIEKGASYHYTSGPNIVNELNTVLAQLPHYRQMKSEDVKTDILVLFHLVGDLHMPLHVGYGEDKGGNSVKVLFLGQHTNLHKVWDERIIEHEDITARDCMALYASMSNAEINRLRVVNVEQWLKEPRSVLPVVYDFSNGEIDEVYAARNKVVIERQLLIAGIRLASALEKVFRT